MSNSRSITEELYKNKVISLFGCVFFTIGFWMLFTNEGKAIRTAHVLEEALNTVVVLNPFEPRKRDYDGGLIYICSRIQIDEPLTEPHYGISVQAVKLKRRVQMFQWIEERTSNKYSNPDNVEEQVNYYYYTDWKEKLIDSTGFYMRAGHENPREIPIKSQVQISDVVKIGPLQLSSPAKMKFVDYFEITSDERPDRRDIKLHMGLYYHTDDIWNPEIGDIRIQFSYAGPSGQEVTVIGQQDGDTIAPFYTKQGVEILMVRPLAHSLEEMFHMEHSDLRFETWKTRAFGWILLLIAANCLSSAVHVFVSRVPILKNINSLDSTIYTNIAVTVSATLVIIAFSWMAQKPLFALSCMIMAIAPYVYCTTVLHNINNVQYVRSGYQRM